MGLVPTTEQQRALELFATGESLAVEAGAGTGKTSTLLLLAQATKRRGQYIAFNKAIVGEAKEKFPANVACSTAHSLAYRAMIPGTRFGDRLRNSRRMKSTEIAAILRVDQIRVQLADGESKVLSKTYLAGLAMRGVLRFCQSADAEPDARHVPYIDGIDVPPGNRTNNRIVARALVPAMRRAWKDLTDGQGVLPFKHDHYLKMWHLSEPTISVDFILFDEAQDANPVLVDIVRKQEKHAQLVWVGDSQQQIYTFTGAVNALATVGAENVAYLTQSFRFGPAVAEQANEILSALDAPLRLKGLDSIDSRIETVDDPDVILCRTNAAAVRNFLDALKEGKRPHLVGGGREVVDFAKGARDLMGEGWTSHPELACFSSWGEVQDYVEQDEQGGDLRLLVGLIDEFGVETILNALERMPREDGADLVISTAHKSKGREWASVRLADDFPEKSADEELRLLYVACTRAKLRLDVSFVPWITAQRYAAAEADAEDTTDAEEAHDAPEHDFASCPVCIQEAREAEHEAEGACTASTSPTPPGATLDIYVGRSDSYKVSALIAVGHAREIYERTGKSVTVLDGDDLIVEFSR